MSLLEFSSASIVGGVNTNADVYSDSVSPMANMNPRQREIAKALKKELGFDTLDIAEEILKDDFLKVPTPEELAWLLKQMREESLDKLHPNTTWDIDELKEKLKEELPKSKYHKLL